jgi:hypothetical protein
MKNLLRHSVITFMLIFIGVGCGEMPSSDKSSADVTVGFSQESGYFDATIIIPSASSLGSTIRIIIDQKDYLIGSETSSNIINYIESFQEGSYRKSLKGNYSKESGRFPNPTVEFDVFNISEVK